MPGAPNRPPDMDAPPPPPATHATPAQKVLRRLAPSRVALRLDLWKGSPHGDLLVPFDKAEALYAAADFPGAEGALDQLSVRFAEPRWPSLPAPFLELRASIPAPQPPHWDPESALTPPEREARRTLREAERQVRLARGSVEWARNHSIGVEDLLPLVERAEQTLSTAGPSDTFWVGVDTVWTAVRERVPAPTRTPARPPAPVTPAAAEGAEEA